MVDRAGNTILNFDTGIARILTQSNEPQAQLPGKARLDPTDAKAMNVMARLLSSNNLQSLVQQGLVPQISNRDVLQPNKFMEALDMATKDLEHTLMDSFKGGDLEALKDLHDQLTTVRELRLELEAYMNALIAG